MLIDGVNEVYFFDRDHNIFKVDGLTFPYRKDLSRHLRNTLLDGVSFSYNIPPNTHVTSVFTGNGYR